MALTFLHVSDIHFHKGSESIYCLDSDIRNEMMLDVEEFAKKEQLIVNGIIICGDIAYSGKKEEYDNAATFIDEIVDVLNVEAGCVYCVPGNHDVDQSVVKNSVSLYALQKLLENCDDNEMSEYLEALRRDECTSSKDVLYEPIREYNKFAMKYGVGFSMDKPNWSQKIPLNETYSLCVFGMNSTIISNHDDHKNANKKRCMHIGKNQLPRREKNTIYMTICHHPPTDWLDSDMENQISQRVAIQLYGHKHVQGIEVSGQSVKIATGALQPNRREAGWQPRYNFLLVEICHNILKIRVYPRIWDAEKTQFRCEDKECEAGKVYKEFQLQISDIPCETRDTDDKSVRVHIMSVSERKFIHLIMRKSKVERKRILARYAEFKEFIDQNIEDVLEQIIECAIVNGIMEKLIMELETDY